MLRLSWNQCVATLYSHVCICVHMWMCVFLKGFSGYSGPLTCSSSVTLKRSDKPKISASMQVHFTLIPPKMFWFKVVCILCCQGQLKKSYCR